MDYDAIIAACRESDYLISMTPLERVVAVGHHLGLGPGQRVLDLCCGYGEMLKIWAEAFGIAGTGVDRDETFIAAGRQRLRAAGLAERVSLVEQDVTTYRDDARYDVACLSGVGGLFGGLRGNIRAMEPYLKPGGRLVMGEPFLRRKDVPPELLAYEGDLYTLEEIYGVIRECGYYLTYMASGTPQEWERYITWSARRDVAWLRAHPDHPDLAARKARLDHWYEMYFRYRRDDESWALFVLEHE